jgi:DNA-binding transcriptional regulator GbsR (MarR family)
MDIFKSTWKVILALYESDESLYLSEIARITGETKSVVRVALSKLVRNKIASQKKMGPKIKFYKLNPRIKEKLKKAESNLRNMKFTKFVEILRYFEEMDKEIREKTSLFIFRVLY